jgi:hypothetical protein
VGKFEHDIAENIHARVSHSLHGTPLAKKPIAIRSGNPANIHHDNKLKHFINILFWHLYRSERGIATRNSRVKSIASA